MRTTFKILLLFFVLFSTGGWRKLAVITAVAAAQDAKKGRLPICNRTPLNFCLINGYDDYMPNYNLALGARVITNVCVKWDDRGRDLLERKKISEMPGYKEFVLGE